MAIVQYARKNEVTFIGNSLFPDRTVLCFLGDVDVTNYCQTANHLYLTSSTAASKFRTGVGIINSSSNVFARVIATSNNRVYLDNNYITVKIGQYGTDTLTVDQYKPDTVVCQTTVTKVITQNQIKTSPGMGRARKRSYDNGLLHQYGVYIDPWKQNKSFTQTYRLLFPQTGWYQFTYQADEFFALWLDDLDLPQESAKIPYTYTGRRGWEMKVKYFWIEAGAHTIKFKMQNNSKSPQSVALVIRGADTIHGSGTEPTNTGFYAFPYGYFDGNGWTSGIGTKYSDDPVNGKLIFQTRDEPKAVIEYKVTPTFVGRVQYYDKANTVLAIRPEYGSFTESTDDELSTIRIIGDNGIIKTAPLANVTGDAIITGNLYPEGSYITEILDSPSGFSLVSGNTAQISLYEHRSGLIVSCNKQTETTSANLNLQGNVNSTFINQPFTYSDDDGNWHYSTISAINSNNEIVLSDEITTAISSNCAYSIGHLTVDDDGVAAGIFNVPEGENNKITAGQYKFRLTDNVDGAYESMSAEATYTTGTLNKITADKVVSVSTTSNNGSIAELRKGWSRRGFDPVAQVFFVPGTAVALSGETSSPYGYWASSVDLWFRAKSLDVTSLPVTVRIVQVQNNVPTNNVLAEATVAYKDVIVSTTPYSDNNGTVDDLLATKFKFADPIYLAPDTKYAITVYSDSPYYELFIAESSKTVIGTSTIAANSTIGGRIKSAEPYVEQFYKSQNASVWTPILNTDLMFRVNKCRFVNSGGGSVLFKPIKVSTNDLTSNVNMDAIIFNSVDSNQQPTSTNYILRANNSNGQLTNSITIEPDKLINFGADLAASIKTSTRRRTYVPGDVNSLSIEAQMSSTSQDTTPVILKENMAIRTLENVVNDHGISNNNIVISSAGRHSNTGRIQLAFSAPDDPNGTYAQGSVILKDSILNTDIQVLSAGSHVNAANITISFSSPDIPTANGGMKANAYVSALPVSASTIVVDVPGSGYIYNSPTITFTETGVTSVATANVYSNAYSVIMTETGSGYYKKPTVTITEDSTDPNIVNATASIACETDSIGGNALARYITKRVDLAEGFTAGDLRVYLDCIRPSGTNVNVYYKVRSPYDSEAFESKKWQLMDKALDVYSPDQHTTIELEFKPTVDDKTRALKYTQDGVDYPLGGVFNQFAIKVTMSAANPSVVPIVTNLAAMAIPAG